MRLRLLAAVAAAVLGGVSVAIAAHVPQVDPATVPTGFLATHNNAADVPQGSLRRIARARGGIDTFVQHVRLTAGADTGWHTHPGPGVVSVVGGALTYEDSCIRATYGPGTGFVDQGFGHVHHAIAGPEGADFYVTLLAPHGSPSQTIATEPPGACPDDDDDEGRGDDD
jgi:quercetin dioxygenase-like cupin family protein